MKRPTKIFLLVALVVVAAIAAIPLFVKANTFRPVIQKQLSAALGRSVKLGDLRLPPFSGRLVADEDARVAVASKPARGESSVYEHVNLTARDFSFGTQVPFELSADLAAGGSISATGHLGPINRDDAATSPGDAQISVKHLDPIAAGFLAPDAGASFVADADVHAASDGQALSTNAAVHLENLKLRKGAPAAPKPLDLTYSGTHRLKENTGVIQ